MCFKVSVLLHCGLFIHIWINFDSVNANLACNFGIIFAIITVLDFSTNELQANYLEKEGNLMEKYIIYEFKKKVLEKKYLYFKTVRVDKLARTDWFLHRINSLKVQWRIQLFDAICNHIFGKNQQMVNPKTAIVIGSSIRYW